MMKYVFGPVPSRRLGQSLGIDPIPLKTCNWNCVYCQLGRSKPMVNQRQVFVSPKEIVSQVIKALDAHNPGEIDWITFVGSGETTLHANLGNLIRQVKLLTSIPVAVITNGSLLYLPQIRHELEAADAVMPSLDAGNEELYRKINRPHPDFTFERLTRGMIEFRKEYQGNLWVEVMLIDGLNDSEEVLTEIARVLSEIQPDEVHIIQPSRPPSETWVKPVAGESLLRARAILGENARVIDETTGLFDLSGCENLIEAIVAIITRHPMRETELLGTLSHFSSEDVLDTLKELEKSGQAQIVQRHGVNFWSAFPANYSANGRDS